MVIPSKTLKPEEKAFGLGIEERGDEKHGQQVQPAKFWGALISTLKNDDQTLLSF